MSWNTENTAFVMVPNGYNTLRPTQEGFSVFKPYKDKDLFSRVIREVWFKVPILNNRIWYDKHIIMGNPEYILVNDPLITEDYLVWLHENIPNAQINFLYGNMIGKGKHLYPNQIPKFVRVWTYDDYDARTYNLAMYPYSLNPELINQKKQPEYDVFFIGKDKGRGDWLIQFEKELNELGLKTKFIITKDGRTSANKSYYQQAIPYSEVIDYCKRSRAILNVVMENQEGVTMRDLEATALNVKLITTNKHIKDKDFYNPNNVFILGERDIKELAAFIRSRPYPIPEGLIEAHSYKGRLDVITGDR